MIDLIRDSRIDLQLTQKEVARRAGISRVYFCEIEHGRQAPLEGAIDAIADVLGIDREELACAMFKRYRELHERKRSEEE